MIRIDLWLEKHKGIVRLLTVSYMLFIFILSSMPRPPQPLPPHECSSVIEHIVEYAILCFLLSISLADDSGINKKNLLFAVVIASLYGVSDEFHQSFVPGRVSSIYDVLADFFGSILAALLRIRLR